MPAISRIRFTNLIYENGAKRYGDEVFQFDSHNGVILLENGGGKTVFVQAVLQTILPHAPLAERKAKDTFALENSPLHLAVEWILNERPRRYALTAVTLFPSKEGIDSYKYVYEYEAGDEHSLENLPFVKEAQDGKTRPASKEEMYDYYQYMSRTYLNARYFARNREYQAYIEENLKIIISEWRSIARINGAEGEIEGFFEGCKTTSQLVDQLLIPTVEEALAGNGTEDFVETFEKQRDHFKKHRQLRQRIEESQRVETEISHYVEAYSAFDQARQGLLQVKGETKALYQLATENRDQVEKDLQQHQEACQSLKSRRYEWDRKMASYELAQLQQELERAEKAYRSRAEELHSQQQDYDLHNQRLQNLELAWLRGELKANAEEMAYCNTQLQSLEADKDVQQLAHQIEKNTGCIRFCYQQEEGFLQSRLQEAQGRQGDLHQELQKMEGSYQEKQGQYQELLVKKGQAQQQQKTAEREMREIAAQLLANPRHDDVHQEKKKWEQRTGVLEQDRMENQHCQQQLKEEKQHLNHDLPQLRQQLQQAVSEEVKLKNYLDNIDAAHANLLLKLKELRSELYAVDSLYLQPSRVVEHLVDAVETLRAGRELSLLQESQAAALFALYKESSYFTAEPRVETWIEDWREQFQYLEAGTVYVQKAARQFSRAESEYFQVYPFWAITIICLGSDVDRLIERLNKRAGELSHPLFVLSQDEARSLIENLAEDRVTKWVPARQIIPSHWELNLSPETYRDWKQELERAASVASAARKGQEAELQRLEEFYHQIIDFLEQYPYETYRQTRQELNETREQVLSLDQAIRKSESRLGEIEGQLTQLQKNQQDIEAELILLSQYIQQAQTYLRRETERNNARVEIRQHDELIQNKTQEMETIQREQKRVEEKRKQAEHSRLVLQNDLRHLQKERLYVEVRDIPPIKTDLTRQRLEMERNSLLDNLHQKQKGRQSIEEQLKAGRIYKEKLQSDLSRKRRQCEYDIDEDLLFPPGGEAEMDSLINHIGVLKQGLTKLSPILKRKEKEYNLAQDRYQRQESEFYQRFQDKSLFAEALAVVQEQLKKEKEELELQGKYLDQQAKKLGAEQDAINQAVAELERKNERYEFLPDHIDCRDLPASIRQDFPYQRLLVVSRYMKILQSKQEQQNYRADELETEKIRLENFCREQVADVKLKEMVTAGLKNRDSYEQVQEWNSRLSQRIARTIQIAEEDMREHDRELQQFINHLHSYLGTVAAELRLIPRKTRVKVEDNWKDIFIFDVPIWDEKEGKNELRRHVDWMINQIESNRYQDEHGVENYALMHKDIKKWLESQQLLLQVMKDKSIKVKCRKVTGDGKVSSYPNTWESSNQWSGGEKWSKNMALFLGILNYLAEKRQAINPRTKRSRTVILDNPFGKASSEHVLDPVFFIAENLGFQIIALTALAEGKFVRQYFPLVYSLRLRPTASEEKYLVKSDREIRYAYFQDHEPEALRRLGEHQQMELFSKTR